MAQSNQNLVKIIAAVAILGAVAIGGYALMGGKSDTSELAAATPAASSSASSDVAIVQPAQAATEDAAAPAVDKLPPLPAGMTEMYIGKADAPVTLVEFFSLTCPHCREFMLDRLPNLEMKYVDSGKLRIVLRDFPLDGYAMKAAMISRCAGDRDRYVAFVHTYFLQQPQWVSGDPEAGLENIAKLGGMSKSQIDACLANKDLAKNIVSGMQEASDKLGINATPGFLLDGETFSGTLPISDYETRIDAALKKAGVATE
jgi:protein-disulfide isomerase